MRSYQICALTCLPGLLLVCTLNNIKLLVCLQANL